MRISASFALGALAAGCTLAPAYHRPPAPIPSQWPQGQPYAPAQDAARAAADIPWREVFADPKLAAVIETALRQNRDLRVAIANIQASRGQYRAQRAALLPTIAATLSDTRSRVPANTITPGARGHVTGDFYSGELGFSAYELDVFGRLRSLSRAARERYLATAEAARAVRISLIGEVASDYLLVAADRALLAVSQMTMKSSQESYDLAQSRFKNGIASELDVRQAETVLQQARGDAARAMTLAAQARNALDLVVGAPVDGSLLADDLDQQTIPSIDPPAGLRSTVLLSRPDVLQAEHQLKAANANVGAARAAFFPDILLTAPTGGASTALSTLFRGENASWSFTPSASLPLFTGGRNLGNLSTANANLKAAVAQYEKSIQTAFREVADALAERGSIDEQADAQAALTEAADASLRLSTARYENGVDSYLNTLDARRTLYAAQRGLISVKLDRALNLITLYRTLGGGLAAPSKTAPKPRAGDRP